MSTIDGGHYPPLSLRGRAVRPDAYVICDKLVSEAAEQMMPHGAEPDLIMDRIPALAAPSFNTDIAEKLAKRIEQATNMIKG